MYGTQTQFFAKLKSLKGNTCARIYTNGKFIQIFPMKSKSDVSDLIVMFIEDVGTPQKLMFDGSQEQNGLDSNFMKTVPKNQIMWSNSEPYSQWKNQSELGLREANGKVKRRRCRRNIPRHLWGFQFKHAAELIN